MTGIYQDPPKSNQEAFDRVWQRFVVEGAPRAVRTDGFCVYRTADGTHGCAIGCQLPDALYKPDLEGYGVLGLFDRASAIKEHFAATSYEFLTELQEAHDCALPRFAGAAKNDPADLAARLQVLAYTYGLTIPGEAA